MVCSSDITEALSSPSVITSSTCFGRLAPLASWSAEATTASYKRRAAFGVDMRESLAKLADVGGEVLIDIGLIGEVHDESLIVLIRRLDQIKGRCS